jgi:hypothetical protein
MKYALLIYEDETFWDRLSPEEMGEVMAGYGRFGETAGPRIQSGEALHPTATATSVRVRTGERLLTDGPFAETAEQLGGFYVVDVGSLDEAVELAAQIPGAASGVVEIRPVMEFSEDGQPLSAEAGRAAG